MGTWICHLRIAEALLPSLPQLDAVAFSFGNLAPDSGIPNADWTAFDPPKEVTHFLRPGEGEGRIRDLAFYHDYVLPARREPLLERDSFLLGYFCHLLCDNLWSRRIVAATKQAHAGRLQQDASALWEDVKTDWYDLDQCYVRDHPASLFWRMLPAPNPPMYVPLVPTPALHQQLDFIRNYYSQPDPARQLDRPYPYLNQQTMDRFVQESAADIGLIIEQLQRADLPADAVTALQLLDLARLQPYALPLGDPVAVAAPGPSSVAVPRA